MTRIQQFLEKIQTDKKQKNIEGQLTQLKAKFTLNKVYKLYFILIFLIIQFKIDLYIDEEFNNWNENEESKSFLHLILDSILVKTKLKTFDMEFNVSLTNLILYHEQFIGKDNQHLCLLSALLNKENSIQTLISLHFLHTSSENPLFQSLHYNGIENRLDIHFTKLIVILQLEALLSILKFQDILFKNLFQETLKDELKKKNKEQRQTELVDENKRLERSLSMFEKVGKNGKN